MQEYEHSYSASVGVAIKNECTCYDLINGVVSCALSIGTKINWMIQFELQLLASVDNYYVNTCSHQSADSHQLRGPGDTEQLSHFLSNLLHKDQFVCPVEREQFSVTWLGVSKSLIMLKKRTYNSQYIAHYAQVEPIKNLMLTETDMSRINYENFLPIMLFSKNP